MISPLHHFRASARYLARHKIYTISNILGLAVGLAACLCIALIARYEFSFDRFESSREQIYQVGSLVRDGSDDPVHYQPSVWPGFPAAFAASVPGIEGIAAYHQAGDLTFSPSLSTPGQKFTGDMTVTDNRYFTIIPYSFLAGDSRSSLAEPGSAVISRQRARQYFGAISPGACLGKTIFVSDSIMLHITGVVADRNDPSDFAGSLFVAMPTAADHFFRNLLALDQQKGIPGSSQLLLRLESGHRPALVEAAGARLCARRFRSELVAGIKLLPLNDVHFTAPQHASATTHRPVLYSLVALASFILLLAIINYVNLATAQVMTRVKEMAIRKTLGGSRSRLIRQLLGETVLVTGMAALLAITTVNPVLNAFRHYLPVGLRLHITDPFVLLLLPAAVIVTAALAGLYPALMISRQEISGLLRESVRRPGTGQWTLVAGPVAGYLLHRWLGNFAYRLAPSAGLYLFSGLLLVLMMSATIAIQVLRVLRANPVSTLRKE